MSYLLNKLKNSLKNAATRRYSKIRPWRVFLSLQQTQFTNWSDSDGHISQNLRYFENNYWIVFLLSIVFFSTIIKEGWLTTLTLFVMLFILYMVGIAIKIIWIIMGLLCLISLKNIDSMNNFCVIIIYLSSVSTAIITLLHSTIHYYVFPQRFERNQPEIDYIYRQQDIEITTVRDKQGKPLGGVCISVKRCIPK